MMKVNILRKQAAMTLLGLGCVSVLGVGSVLADDTTGTTIPAGATVSSTTVGAPAAPVASAVPTNGVDLLGKKFKIVNAITGVKGKIISIGFHNTTDSQWHDMTIDKDISSGETPGTATIAELGLTQGKYDKIRVGHEKMEAKGKITLIDEQGNTMVYGSQPKQGNDGRPTFKKGAPDEYFDMNITENEGEDNSDYKNNFEKNDVGSYKVGNVQYDVGKTDLEIVKDSEGKLSVKDNQPITFYVRATYLWAGAGWENLKFPGFDDSYVTAEVQGNEDSNKDVYKYKVTNVVMQHKGDDGKMTREGEEYFMTENGSVIMAGFEDPLEAVGPKDVLVQAIQKQEKEVVEKQNANSTEYTYRQRIF